MMLVAGEEKSPGLRITWTGTVTGSNLGIAKVTEQPASGAGTWTEQGGLAGQSERGRGIRACDADSSAAGATLKNG